MTLESLNSKGWRLWATMSLLVVCDAWAAVGGVTATAIGYDVSPVVISMAWLDHKRLLFEGNKASADPKKVSFSPSKIYIWDDDTKAASVYAEDALDKRFCYSNGYISYIVRADKVNRRAVYREGKFGQEKETERSLDVARVRSQFFCRFKKLEEIVPPLPNNRDNLVLREGDGFLSLAPNDRKGESPKSPRNITLHQENGQSVQLLIMWDEDIAYKEFSAYRNAYVIQPRLLPGSGNYGHWPTGMPRHVYLVSPKGHVERVQFPAMEIFFRPIPTHAGWLYYGSGAQHSRRQFGLYLQQDNKEHLIEPGIVNGIAVSADGCKAVAAINQPLPNMGTPTTLKVVDFCLERK